MVALQKLYFVNMTYFSKVTDWIRIIPTLATANTGVLSASTDSNREFPTVANAHTNVTCARTSVIN